MKRFSLTLILFSLGIFSAFAQEEEEKIWTQGGLLSVNFSQVSLSNWAAGGENNVGFDMLFNYSIDYKLDKTIWQNRLEMAYGMNDMENSGSRKTNDKIYFSSTYGYKMVENLYLSTMLTFESQFAKGYNYGTTPKTMISKFMSPGYLSVGLGLTWTPKPYFKATYTPATWRGTFVVDDTLSAAGAFGVDPGEHLYSAFGSNLKMEYEQEVMKNIKLYSRLELFSDYLDKPQNVDVKWDVQINMTVNKWFSTNLTTNLIYDDDIKILQKDGTSGSRVQFKEVVSVGLKFTL